VDERVRPHFREEFLLWRASLSSLPRRISPVESESLLTSEKNFSCGERVSPHFREEFLLESESLLSSEKNFSWSSASLSKRSLVHPEVAYERASGLYNSTYHPVVCNPAAIPLIE
jgi:hypothetical protein